MNGDLHKKNRHYVADHLISRTNNFNIPSHTDRSSKSYDE